MIRILFLLSFIFSTVIFAFNLEFTTTVKPAPERILEVEAKITNWEKSFIEFTFPHRFGPITSIYSYIKDFKVWNNETAVPLSFKEPESEYDNAAYLAQNIIPGTVIVKYKISPPDYQDYRKLTAVLSLIHDNRAIIKGASTYFGLPANSIEYEDVKLKFNLPEGWKTYCSGIQINSNTCTFDLMGDPGNIKHALYSNAIPVGSWDRQIVNVEGMQLELIRGGDWKFSFDEFWDLVEPPLRWQIQTMGGHNRDKYQIINDTYPKDTIINGKSSGGERLYDSAVSVVMRNITLQDFIENSLHVVVHEFFHTFDWNFSHDEYEKMTWFHEGMTDYMAYMSLFNTVVPFNSAANMLTWFIEVRYWSNWVNNRLSILEASENRWETEDRPWTQNQLTSILYKQVVLTGFVMDWLAEKKQNKNKLFNLMGKLWKEYGKENKILTQDIIYNTFEDIFEASLRNDWVEYLSTTKALPLKNMLTEKGWTLVDMYKPFLGIYVREKNNDVYVYDFVLGLDKNELKELGLIRGDILKELNGEVISNIDAYKRVIATLPMEGNAQLTIQRQGNTKILDAQIFKYRKIIKLEPPTRFEVFRHSFENGFEINVDKEFSISY